MKNQLKPLDLEKLLHTPEYRGNADKLTEVISDSFLEIGSTGNTFSKQNILEQLPIEQTFEIKAYDFSEQFLADDITIIRYKVEKIIDNTSIHSFRTSLWRKEFQKWMLVHHQSTVII